MAMDIGWTLRNLKVFEVCFGFQLANDILSSARLVDLATMVQTGLRIRKQQPVKGLFSELQGEVCTWNGNTLVGKMKENQCGPI